jgi:hypothetical protein
MTSSRASICKYGTLGSQLFSEVAMWKRKKLDMFKFWRGPGAKPVSHSADCNQNIKPKHSHPAPLSLQQKDTTMREVGFEPVWVC